MRRSSLLAALLGALTATACAPAIQTQYVAPTYTNILASTEEAQSNEGQVIYVQNASTVPVVVTSISLRECENLKQSCGPHPMNVRIRPGQRTLVYRVGPDDKDRAYAYRYSYAWVADSAEAQARSVLAAARDSAAPTGAPALAGGPAPAAGSESVGHDRMMATMPPPRAGETWIDPRNAQDFAGRVAALRVVPETLYLQPGDRIGLDTLRTVLVDSRGAVLGRTRMLRMNFVAGAMQMQKYPTMYAVQRGRSVVRFDLIDTMSAVLGVHAEDSTVILVRYPVMANAPVVQGTVRDPATHTPLACLPLALEDSGHALLDRTRTDMDGHYTLKAPIAGTFTITARMHAWEPVVTPIPPLAPGDDMRQDLALTFTQHDSMATFAGPQADHSPSAARVFADPAAWRSATLIHGVKPASSASSPTFTVATSATPGTLWVQFVVGTDGHAVPSTISVPAGASAMQLKALHQLLAGIEFHSAQVDGRAACEMLKLKVNFVPHL